MAFETSKFIQGVHDFSGAGLKSAAALSPAVKYAVPFDEGRQLICSGVTKDAITGCVTAGKRTLKTVVGPRAQAWAAARAKPSCPTS